MGSNPIADMSGWSHSARKRKLALSPGVALRSTQVRMGSAPSLTCGWTHGKEGNDRNTWSAWASRLFLKPFFKRPHTQNFTDLPVSPGMPVWSAMATCRQQPVCPSGLGGELKIHCTQVHMGSNPIADMSGWSHSARKRKLALSPGVALRSTQVRMGSAPSLTCGWRHTERKETKGTRGLPERHTFWLETHGKEGNGRNAWSAWASRLFLKPFFKRPHSKLHRSPSVTRNASVISNGYLSAAASLPEWFRGWT